MANYASPDAINESTTSLKDKEERTADPFPKCPLFRGLTVCSHLTGTAMGEI